YRCAKRFPTPFLPEKVPDPFYGAGGSWSFYRKVWLAWGSRKGGWRGVMIGLGHDVALVRRWATALEFPEEASHDESYARRALFENGFARAARGIDVQTLLRGGLDFPPT